ncbi:VCBS repeat-containing protein [Sporosarcina sp. YIM B06819]|uniref:VCBS repeat-containing protein n=1 Tax=Sporosarcina sp. YIM B06819 TaxID=3081769 RepID=UPI00298D2575|nr:VCBS repeat-containing protein [Sporosarcina sp. YIM B06819]
MKMGDVNGDGVVDTVYLYGQIDGPPGIFADNITLVIQDGRTTKSTTVHLKNNAGYNARLFLGDFNKDAITDIMVSIDTGGSGGYGIFTIYSFRNNRLQELFDVDKYNEKYAFEVHYEDFYKVRVKSSELNVVFMIDISNKGSDYLSQFYDDKGRLKNPVQGGALALGALYPIITNNKSYHFDLLALQRIIGPTNVDTLGYIENLLTWKDIEFISNRLTVSVLGENLR